MAADLKVTPVSDSAWELLDAEDADVWDDEGTEGEDVGMSSFDFKGLDIAARGLDSKFLPPV